jgi:hypothetical protein
MYLPSSRLQYKKNPPGNRRFFFVNITCDATGMVVKKRFVNTTPQKQQEQSKAKTKIKATSYLAETTITSPGFQRPRPLVV